MCPTAELCHHFPPHWPNSVPPVFPILTWNHCPPICSSPKTWQLSLTTGLTHIYMESIPKSWQFYRLHIFQIWLISLITATIFFVAKCRCLTQHSSLPPVFNLHIAVSDGKLHTSLSWRVTLSPVLPLPTGVWPGLRQEVLIIKNK